jgi:hypothetical protein
MLDRDRGHHDHHGHDDRIRQRRAASRSSRSGISPGRASSMGASVDVGLERSPSTDTGHLLSRESSRRSSMT